MITQPDTSKVKVSAFCLTTNAIKNQFPFIESIKSFLPILDELIVVDGGSTDGTVEAIKAIGDSKIKIIQDDDTKWEDEWAYGRMGHNFNRGLQECTGDWAIKFDVDYILHEKKRDSIRVDLLRGLQNEVLCIAFTRLNFILSDRFFAKSKKTLAINKTECKKQGINLKYGLDIERWGWGFDFINANGLEHGINVGDMIRYRWNSIITSACVYNYDYVFMTEDVAKEARWRHDLAVHKQQEKEGRVQKEYVDTLRNDKNIAWDCYKKQCIANMGRALTAITIEQHPEIIIEKVKSITFEQQGCNSWGWFYRSYYYEI